MPGKVVLVGAGPGDPGLITVKGKWYLEKADAVVHDDLVAPELLALTPSTARIIYAGKRKGQASLAQSEINRLLVQLAHEHNLVVRLKGGDPMLFGRAGEELLALAEAGVHFEIVPGVSSALAGPTYAGIPVTHRGLSRELIIRTGHEAEDAEVQGTTTIYLMSATRLDKVALQLQAEGTLPDTPAAVIQWATMGHQRTVVGPLADIPRLAREAGLSSPALLVVGPVVALRDRLRWFDTRPLSGLKILVTRPEAGESTLADKLRAFGASVVALPTIETVPPPQWDPLDRVLVNIGRFHWLIFTSARGVATVFHRLEALSLDARHLASVKIAAVGPGTAKALTQRGIRPDFIPPRYTSEDLAKGLLSCGVEGKRLLLARADIANRALTEILRKGGAEVEEVVAYCTVKPQRLPPALTFADLTDLDVVAFTSASTVDGLLDLLGERWHEVVTPETVVATIGPVTAERARSRGLKVDVIAEQHTLDGLVEAILRYRRLG